MNLRSSLCASSAIVVLAIAASLSGLTPARGQAQTAATSTPALGSPASGAAQAGAAPRKSGTRQGTTRKPVKKTAPAGSKPQAPASPETGQPGTTNGKPAVANLAVSPDQIRFPAVPVTNQSGPRIVTLTNRSTSPLTVNAVVSGDFALDAPTFPQILCPGASMAVAVSFIPKHEGATSGILTIGKISDGAPRKVALSGRTPSFWQSDLFIAFLLCPLYWLAMVTVRWHRVAHTTRALLRAQIYSLMTELSALATTSSCAAGASLMKLLESAKALLDGPREKSGLPIANVLFWSRGQEMTGWGYVHEVEVQMIPCLGDETVTAKLETAERTLRASNDGPCVALANVIHEALVSIPPAALPRRRALLAEALAANYSREDNEFSDLVSWQNKASWLVVCGLLLILALTGAYPQHSILLLVGATGGLLSRLSRSLDRKSVPTDYGASWTTLFLSPVAGALAAWAGILIADLATQAKVLGATFSADWLHPNNTQTLAIALLFGFSERLLDTVLDKLEGKATGAQTQPPKQQAPPTPPPKPQAGPPPTALTITTATLPQGQTDQPYAQVLAAANAIGTVTWSVSQGPLPDGLHLGGDGKLTGVPTKHGIFSFTVTAADQKTTAHQALTVMIS